MDYPIIEATGEKTIQLANEYVTKGTEVIITRGKNLEILRSNSINAILVDVRYTYEDMYFSLKKAKEHSDKIAYIGFHLAYDVAAKFKNISGEDFYIVEPESVSHIDETVKKLSFIRYRGSNWGYNRSPSCKKIQPPKYNDSS